MVNLVVTLQNQQGSLDLNFLWVTWEPGKWSTVEGPKIAKAGLSAKVHRERIFKIACRWLLGINFGTNL
jgi:hypothetical protein